MFVFALHVVAPVALCIGAGWLLGRYRGISSQGLARAGVDIFGPALLLANIPENFGAEPLLAVVLLGTIALLGGLALLCTNALRIENRDHRTGLLLGAMLCNFGYFGLPVVESALGGAAFENAMSILIVLNIPTGFFSAYFGSPNPDAKAALKYALASPFNWSVIAGIVLGLTGIRLPEPVVGPIALLAGAAVPCGLVVLGIELSKIRLVRVPKNVVAAALVLRLAISPMLVAILALTVGMTSDRLLAQTAVLQLATPAGITPLIFMSAANRDASVMAAIVFWSTVVSLLTVPLVAVLISV